MFKVSLTPRNVADDTTVNVGEIIRADCRVRNVRCLLPADNLQVGDRVGLEFLPISRTPEEIAERESLAALGTPLPNYRPLLVTSKASGHTIRGQRSWEVSHPGDVRQLEWDGSQWQPANNIATPGKLLAAFEALAEYTVNQIDAVCRQLNIEKPETVSKKAAMEAMKNGLRGKR